MVEVYRKPGENVTSLVKRFSWQVIRSGILLEAKKRRFYIKPLNKRARREKALYRVRKTREIERKKKLGLM